jgi:uncharacterized protein YceH (UPF0502 family)
MAQTLNDVEVRVLGSLIEKKMSTPDYYPMSLNALVNACNQKSSRDPVVSYDEPMVNRALDSLRAKGFVWSFKGADSRVIKYGHQVEQAFDLHDRAVAALCVLMLRGPQTPGEIKARTKQMWDFESVEQVEEILEQLMANDIQPLVVRLPRQHGARESRYAHLLEGPIDVESLEGAARAESASSKSSAVGDRITRLEEEILSLRAELATLREQFLQFKSQFE